LSRGWAFLALLDRELDALALLEGSEPPLGLNRRVMDENVLISRVTFDETIAFAVVEPLYGASLAFAHCEILLAKKLKKRLVQDAEFCSITSKEKRQTVEV
jgi:hypothetical protein